MAQDNAFVSARYSDAFGRQCSKTTQPRVPCRDGSCILPTARLLKWVLLRYVSTRQLKLETPLVRIRIGYTSAAILLLRLTHRSIAYPPNLRCFTIGFKAQRVRVSHGPLSLCLARTTRKAARRLAHTLRLPQRRLLEDSLPHCKTSTTDLSVDAPEVAFAPVEAPHDVLSR